MIAFFYDSWIVILKFLILGIFLGAIYDIFRFSRIARNDPTYNIKQKIKKRFFPNNTSDNKKTRSKQISESIIIFIEDILFFIVVAITEILAIFHFNNGEIRICYLIISAIGFFVYQKTIGNLIIFFSKKTLHFLRKIIYIVVCIVLIPLCFFLRISRKLLEKICKSKKTIKQKLSLKGRNKT
jgi:hypothetical protein